MRSINRSTSGSASPGESTTSGSRACHSVSHSCRSRPGSTIGGGCAPPTPLKHSFREGSPRGIGRAGARARMEAGPKGLLAFCGEHEIDLVVVGPEAPLVAGLADQLRHAGVAVFGPSAAAARIEGSKTFAKEVMAAAGVPTAARLAVARPPCVVKVDGLAAGKGVFVCRTQEELDAGLQAAGGRGDSLVIEELLEGEEISIFAVCDGRQALPLAPAQDFKRVGDGDSGPNTGGMGSYSPVPRFGPAEVDELLELVH